MRIAPLVGLLLLMVQPIRPAFAQATGWDFGSKSPDAKAPAAAPETAPDTAPKAVAAHKATAPPKKIVPRKAVILLWDADPEPLPVASRVTLEWGVAGVVNPESSHAVTPSPNAQWPVAPFPGAAPGR